MQPSTTDRSTAKQALLEALLSDAGLKNLTQTASTVMGNPVLVVDPVYRYGARGGFELDDADDPTPLQPSPAPRSPKAICCRTKPCATSSNAI